MEYNPTKLSSAANHGRRCDDSHVELGSVTSEGSERW